MDDYRLIPEIIDKGEVYKRSDLKLIYLNRNGKLYRLVLKRTSDGTENYFLSLFETKDRLADLQVRDTFERIR